MVGRGTTIRVVLPAAAPVIATEVEDAGAGVGRGAARGRVLIVDDDRPVASALALELSDHDVVVAGSGREALEILGRDKAFDVVICDLMMPEITGMDLYESLRLTDAELGQRFIFMTGGAFTARAAQFLDAVPNPRLEKPFQREELHALVRSFCRRADWQRPPAPAEAAAPVGSDPGPARRALE